MNAIDKVIAYFNPRAAFEREWARLHLQRLQKHARNYDGANTGRLGGGWTAVSGNAELTDSGYRNTLRDRARDLERNSDFAQAVIDALVRNVVGTGITMQCRIPLKNDPSKFDDALCSQIEEKWEEWCRGRNCDITGYSSFYELQAMALRRMVVDGDSLSLKIYDRTSRIPFKIQMTEPDLLDTGRLKADGTGNLVVSGIEVNGYNKPLAYYFYSQTLDGFTTFQSKRVPADRVIHLYPKHRPTQVRGVSMLASTINRLKDTEEFLEADLVAARIAASFAMFVKTNDGIGRMAKNSTLNTDDQTRREYIEPGMIEYLRPGEDIQTAQPGMQAGNSAEYVKMQTRIIAAAKGMSYEVVSRDMKGSTFSSARQSHLEDRKTFVPLQRFMIEHFNWEIYTNWIISAVLAGEFDIPDFFQDMPRYMKHAWITPGWAWIDPVKEVDAAIKGIGAGLNCYADELASQGKDWEDVYQQRAREQEKAKGLGLVLNIDPKGGATNEQTDETDDGEDESGNADQSGKGKGQGK